MAKTRDPVELGSFPLQYEGSDDPEDLIKAGKYDWVADYSRQIVHSNAASAVSEAGIEIVLLEAWSLPVRETPKSLWAVSMAPDIDLEDAFRKYDPPTVWDVLKFGALYPDKQRNVCIHFPHEPWRNPHGPSFVLVLRSDLGARGLSYVGSSGALLAPWWWDPLVAVRRRRGGP